MATSPLISVRKAGLSTSSLIDVEASASRSLNLGYIQNRKDHHEESELQLLHGARASSELARRFLRRASAILSGRAPPSPSARYYLPGETSESSIIFLLLQSYSRIRIIIEKQSLNFLIKKNDIKEIKPQQTEKMPKSNDQYLSPSDPPTSVSIRIIRFYE